MVDFMLTQIIVKSGHPVIPNTHKTRLWMLRKRTVNQNNCKLMILVKNVVNPCCHVVQCKQYTCRKPTDKKVLDLKTGDLGIKQRETRLPLHFSTHE